MSEKFLRPREVREALGGVSNSTLYAWIRDGKLPPPTKIVSGGRASGWPESVITELIKQRVVQSLTR